MNNITQQQIIERLEKRIDYNEIARILEHDLNLIASEVVEQGEHTPIDFKVFFDFGDFDTYINTQAPGEGQQHAKTPVVISLINGDYSTAKGPELYSTTFRIEAFGFESDKDQLRAIFEAFSSLNQGVSLTEMFNSSMTTSFTDFPVMTSPEPYKGANRMSVFLTWNLNFIYTGQLSNDIVFEIDNEVLDVLSFNIHRNREGTPTQRKDDEMKLNTTSQSVTLTGNAIYDGTEVSKKLMRNIKNKGVGIKEVLEVKITWPSVLDDNDEPDVDVYRVHIAEGDVTATEGGYVDLSFSMSLADEVS